MQISSKQSKLFKTTVVMIEHGTKQKPTAVEPEAISSLGWAHFKTKETFNLYIVKCDNTCDSSKDFHREKLNCSRFCVTIVPGAFR